MLRSLAIMISWMCATGAAFAALPAPSSRLEGVTLINRLTLPLSGRVFHVDQYLLTKPAGEDEARASGALYNFSSWVKLVCIEGCPAQDAYFLDEDDEDEVQLVPSIEDMGVVSGASSMVFFLLENGGHGNILSLYNFKDSLFQHVFSQVIYYPPKIYADAHGDPVLQINYSEEGHFKPKLTRTWVWDGQGFVLRRDRRGRVTR